VGHEDSEESSREEIWEGLKELSLCMATQQCEGLANSRNQGQTRRNEVLV